MKAVTANRLADGVVVYLSADGAWTERLQSARFVGDAEAESVLADARERVTEIAAAYLIEASGGRAAGREALRETIRNSGPTVRRDLGKQAEPSR